MIPAIMIRCLMVCICFLCLQVASAQTANEDLQFKLNNIVTIQASYTQTVHRKNHAQILSSGTMALAKPRHFTWHTIHPSAQWLIADGKRIWLYDPELEQVSVKSQAHGVGGAVGIFLSGNTKNLTRSFKITEEKKGHKTYFFLQAISAQSGFQQVTLIFDGAAWVGLSFIDALDQRTTIQFTSVKINKPLPAGLFQFKRPEGVDVVSQ